MFDCFIKYHEEISRIDSQIEELQNKAISQYGLSKSWLISHGLASEQEILRLQQSHNTTGISYRKMKSGMRIDSVELSGSVIIPEFIEGEPVVKIASGAFANRKDITSVVLPQYLLEIDEKSFAESGIISLTIPDSVQLIGEKAFFNCRQLERITLPVRILEVLNRRPSCNHVHRAPDN